MNHDNQAKPDTILHRALRVPVAAFVLVMFGSVVLLTNLVKWIHPGTSAKKGVQN